MTDKVEQKYQSFWKDIVEKDGVVDLDQVKKELFDFSFLLEQTRSVYFAISKGLLSKTTYHAHVLIEKLEENFYDRKITQDDVRQMLTDCSDIEELKDALVTYFELEQQRIK